MSYVPAVPAGLHAAAVLTPGPLACRVVSDPREAEALAPAWSALLTRSVCNEPVLSPDWTLAWWRVFGGIGGRSLRIAAFYQQDRLVGLAPLLWRRYYYPPAIPFRRLEPLGVGETSADAIYPDYLGLLAERGSEQLVADGLAHALLRDALGPWEELVLPMLDGNGVLLPLLNETFQRVGLRCETVVTGSASYITLPATWDEYLAQLPGSRRAYVRDSVRRFEKWADGAATTQVVTEQNQLDEGRRVLELLHQQRWDDAGKFSSPLFTAFHRAALPLLFERGALELMWMCVRGEPVAALYNIVWNGKTYFYQSGRKLDVPKGIRPGIVLHTHAIRRAIEAGRREYDFLSGGEQYKCRLALAMRPLVRLRVARPCLLESMRCLAKKSLGWGLRVNGFARGFFRTRGSGPASASEPDDRQTK